MQFRFAVLAFAAAALAACDRDTDLTSPGASAENSRSADADVDRGEPAGPLAVYTITNQRLLIQDGERLGQLKVSRGSIDWKPGKAKKTWQLEWERFDQLMREFGHPPR